MKILQSEQINRRLVVIAAISVEALIAGAIWLAFSLLHPTPPRLIAMAINPEGSFSAELGNRYRELLARDGIELRLVPTAGAVESLARLRDPRSGVSIAIIPGGISNQEDSPLLVSLGTLFYEPLWLFSRGKHLESLEQLRNLRISIGPEGSASHVLAVKFLTRVDVYKSEGETDCIFEVSDY
jgi:TRAP-type uncharacterized transport system substrate-binding protein